MKYFSLIFLLLTLTVIQGNAQTRYQYFDGGDTISSSTLEVYIDTMNTDSNIWQIGTSQKTIFHSAATQPNAIVTDTVNYYPSNDSSSFSFGIGPEYWGSWGIVTIQCKQKR